MISSTSKGFKKWSIWSLNTNIRLFNLLNKFFISFILSISFTLFLAQNINPLSLTVKLKLVYPKDLHDHVDVVKNHSKRILLNHCIYFPKPYTVSFGKKILKTFKNKNLTTSNDQTKINPIRSSITLHNQIYINSTNQWHNSNMSLF